MRNYYRDEDLRAKLENVPSLKGDEGFLTSILSSFIEAQAGAPTQVSEDLAIPVGVPTDSDTAEIPSGVMLVSQADVTAALNGKSKFRYLNQVLQALPRDPGNSVITLDAGIHYADPNTPSTQDAAWAWFPDVKFGNYPTIKCDETVTILGPLVVTAHQDGSGDPYLEFAGAPFSGNWVKGLFVDIDGVDELQVIQDVSGDNRLHLTKNISGITNDVTTVRVVRPGAILRNALAGTPTTRFKSTNCVLIGGTGTGGAEYSGGVVFQNVMVQGMRAMRGFTLAEAPGLTVKCTNVMIDQELQRQDTGLSPDGFGWIALRPMSAQVDLNLCSYVVDKANLGSADAGLWLACRYGNSFLRFSYIGASDDAPTISGAYAPGLVEGGTHLLVYSSVFDGTPGVLVTGPDSSIAMYSFLGTKCRIRDGGYGVRLEKEARWFINSFQDVVFDTLTGNALEVLSSSKLDLSGASNALVATSVTGVAMSISGVRTEVAVDSAQLSSFSGSGGDCEIEGHGTAIDTWANRAGASPITVSGSFKHVTVA